MVAMLKYPKELKPKLTLSLYDLGVVLESIEYFLSSDENLGILLHGTVLLMEDPEGTRMELENLREQILDLLTLEAKRECTMYELLLSCVVLKKLYTMDEEKRKQSWQQLSFPNQEHARIVEYIEKFLKAVTLKME